MFKLADDRPENQQPCFVCMCDNPRCDATARMEIPEGEPYSFVKASFVDQLREKRWGFVEPPKQLVELLNSKGKSVTLEQMTHYCDKHNELSPTQPAKKLIQAVKLVRTH